MCKVKLVMKSLEPWVSTHVLVYWEQTPEMPGQIEYNIFTQPGGWNLDCSAEIQTVVQNEDHTEAPFGGRVSVHQGIEL